MILKFFAIPNFVYYCLIFQKMEKNLKNETFYNILFVVKNIDGERWKRNKKD